MKKQKFTRLYYVEAWSRLSEQRERISGYCSNRHLADFLCNGMKVLHPDESIYLQPLVKSCKADEVLKH